MNGHQRLVAVHALATQEIRRFLRIWPQSLFAPALTLTLYLFIFHNLATPLANSADQANSLHFIVPGLILMGVITSSYDNVSLSFFSAKFRKTLEELLTSPMSNHLIVHGYLIGSLIRAFMVAMISSLMAWALTDLSLMHPIVLFMILFISAIFFSLCGLISTFLIDDFDQLAVIPNFILLPLLFSSGIFYDIDALSPHWQMIHAFNPITYLVDCIRYSFIAGVRPNIPLIMSAYGVSIMALYRLADSLLTKMRDV